MFYVMSVHSKVIIDTPHPPPHPKKVEEEEEEEEIYMLVGYNHPQDYEQSI